MQVIRNAPVYDVVIIGSGAGGGTMVDVLTKKGINVALLECRAFVSRKPASMQTWRLHMNAHGVRAVGDGPVGQLEFDREAFAGDVRIASLRWERT